MSRFIPWLSLRPGLTRGVLSALLVASFGLPIVEEWKAIFLFFGIFSIWTGHLNPTSGKLWSLACCVVMQKAILIFCPTSRIEVGENILLIRDKPSLMEAAWPSTLRDKWRDHFLMAYPSRQGAAGNSWQKSQGPRDVYSFHPESFWREAKYSRSVADFRFHGLYELRAGFVNDMLYNFWEGDIHRRRMPFWVLVEPGKFTEGGKLFWQGEAVQVNAEDKTIFIFHTTFHGQTLLPQDAGSRWYFAFYPEAWPEYRGEDPNFKNKSELVYQELRQNSAYPRLEFRPPVWAQLASRLQDFLVLVILALIVTQICRPDIKKAIMPLLLALSAYLVIKTMMHFDWGKNLLDLYPPHGGGDDGLAHESWGLGIVRALGDGDFAAALTGGEPVFYFTPGMRYFRAIEKIIFGATNLGYTLCLMLLPVVFLGFLRNWLPGWAAASVIAVFVILPPNMNFSLSSYVTLGRLGYPAPLATLFFVAALYILFYDKKLTKARKNLFWFWAGFFLFLAIFLRPNHAIPAGAASLYALWSCWKNKEKEPFLFFISGLAFFLLLPAHNLLLGKKFAWITSSVGIALPIPWSTYLHAAREILSGEPGEYFEIAFNRFKLIGTESTLVFPSWLAPTTWIGLVFRTCCFGITLWNVLGGYRQKRERLFWLSLIALASFPFLLIVHYPSPRYIALGWDLTICTAVITLFYNVGKLTLRR